MKFFFFHGVRKLCLHAYVLVLSNRFEFLIALPQLLDTTFCQPDSAKRIARISLVCTAILYSCIYRLVYVCHALTPLKFRFRDH